MQGHARMRGSFVNYDQRFHSASVGPTTGRSPVYMLNIEKQSNTILLDNRFSQLVHFCRTKMTDVASALYDRQLPTLRSGALTTKAAFVQFTESATTL